MIRPLGNRVLIKQKVLKEEVSKSGIVLASSCEKRFPLGEVKAVGEEVLAIKIGDTVMFEGWNGEPVLEEIGGEPDLAILKVDRIIAVVV